MLKKRKHKSIQSTPSIIIDLLGLYHYLSRRRQWQLAVLLALMLLTSIVEMVSVGAIFPFLLVLNNAEGLLQEPRLQVVFWLLQVDTTERLMLLLALGFILALGVANGLRLLNFNMQLKLAAAIAADISSRVYENTLYQPYSFHVMQNSSDLIQTVTSDIDRLTNHVLISSLAFLTNALVIPALIFTLLLVDWSVAIGAALILGTTYALIFRTSQRLLRRNSVLYTEAGQHKVKLVQEGIGGIRQILLDHAQPFFQHSYRLDEQVLRRAAVTNRIIAQSPVYIIEFLALGSIVLLALSLSRGEDFSQVVPVLGSFALGGKRLVQALQQLFSAFAQIQGASSSLDRVMVALKRPIDPFMLLPLLQPLELERELKLQGVWFRYGKESDWVLRDLDLTIAAKTTVGLVGSSGSGKSTTADLILGLLPPEQGQILVDGVPLTGERLKRWRGEVAYVPQQIYLSDSSLAVNIAFGIPEKAIDQAQVRRVAKLAQIDGFIEGLPAGYDTCLGERGIRLSGGQRQRIGIARALYKNASVIVFDEATSALDNATEREVMDAIDGLGGQFTIILIAHRLSTLERCDLVIELERGHVVPRRVMGS
jgi:ABC-type multidrug transport system fused ATPase/permease subunit